MPAGEKQDAAPADPRLADPQITAELITHQGGAKIWQYLRDIFQGPPRQASQQCLEAGGPHAGQVQQLRLSEAPTRHVATAVYYKGEEVIKEGLICAELVA